MSQETKTGYRQVSPGIHIPFGSRHVPIHVILVSFRHSVHHDMLYSQLIWVGLYTPTFLSTHDCRCASQSSICAYACRHIHPPRPLARYDSFLTSVVTASSICLSFRPAGFVVSSSSSHAPRGLAAVAPGSVTGAYLAPYGKDTVPSNDWLFSCPNSYLAYTLGEVP